MNEKLVIMGVPKSSPMFPAIWINNTGTITVWLDKIYLLDLYNGSVLSILDMRTIRPGFTSNLIIDVATYNYNATIPAPGR
ncbi:MAG: hypothetical protein GSR86_04315, partial [Desulfurococcales archaeon]|nr:hypothetical protein [Desulfurococcales archaeon]